jgi:hypothetical protein
LKKASEWLFAIPVEKSLYWLALLGLALGLAYSF